MVRVLKENPAGAHGMFVFSGLVGSGTKFEEQTSTPRLVASAGWTEKSDREEPPKANENLCGRLKKPISPFERRVVLEAAKVFWVPGDADGPEEK